MMSKLDTRYSSFFFFSFLGALVGIAVTATAASELMSAMVSAIASAVGSTTVFSSCLKLSAIAAALLSRDSLDVTFSAG